MFTSLIGNNINILMPDSLSAQAKPMESIFITKNSKSGHLINYFGFSRVHGFPVNIRYRMSQKDRSFNLIRMPICEFLCFYPAQGMGGKEHIRSLKPDFLKISQAFFENVLNIPDEARLFRIGSVELLNIRHSHPHIHIVRMTYFLDLLGNI